MYKKCSRVLLGVKKNIISGGLSVYERIRVGVFLEKVFFVHMLSILKARKFRLNNKSSPRYAHIHTRNYSNSIEYQTV